MKHNLIRHGHMLRIKSILNNPKYKYKQEHWNDCGMPDTMRILNDTWKWFVRVSDSFVLVGTNKRGSHRSNEEVRDFATFKKYYYKQASALGIVG